MQVRQKFTMVPCGIAVSENAAKVLPSASNTIWTNTMHRFQEASGDVNLNHGACSALKIYFGIWKLTISFYHIRKTPLLFEMLSQCKLLLDRSSQDYGIVGILLVEAIVANMMCFFLSSNLQPLGIFLLLPGKLAISGGFGTHWEVFSMILERSR
ncbi:hypothetical protein BZA77DRAFT_26855 [Pyronema omphalodes]|nr:hypothetical protein BZA77DRAFT_26855 [Pyronema omphalodes]